MTENRLIRDISLDVISDAKREPDVGTASNYRLSCRSCKSTVAVRTRSRRDPEWNTTGIARLRDASQGDDWQMLSLGAMLNVKLDDHIVPSSNERVVARTAIDCASAAVGNPGDRRFIS